MGDWQDLLQSVVIGLIFAYLVAKLISTVLHFREDNLKVVREEDVPSEPFAAGAGSESRQEVELKEIPEGRVKKGRDEDDGDEDSDDDWEGVESTELDEAFIAATAFVAATAADRGTKVSNDVQLELYGLYKIATEGPCTAPQPSPLKMTARAKWNAWQKLGAMPPEEAMEKYIMTVNELFPSWATGSSSNKVGASQTLNPSTGTMGPVFSSLIQEEEADSDIKLEAIHASAREGDVHMLAKYLESGVPVNVRDSEGRTALHWAVDRGHLDVVELLIERGADLDAKDNEGQTPLHYAAICDRKEIAETLVTHAAACDVKDNDGNSPNDLCGSAWDFIASPN